MTLRAWAFVISLLTCTTIVWGTPIYRAGEKTSTSRSWLHGEISAGYLFSSNQVEYVSEEDASSRLNGAELRALWSPLPWLALGAEFDKLGNEKLSPMIEKYAVDRLGGIVKLTLSPNTTPRFYLIGSYGKSKHRLKYDHSYFPVRKRPDITQDFAYWMIGLGIEADVWKCFFVGLEGNWIHYEKDHLSELFKMPSRVETDLRIRLGIRF